MGRPYSDDLRTPVVAAMENGMSCREAAALFGVAPSTAGNWHRLHRQTQSVSARPMGGDRGSKLVEHAERISALLGEGSQLRLVDVQAALAAEGWRSGMPRCGGRCIGSVLASKKRFTPPSRTGLTSHWRGSSGRQSRARL